MLTSSVLPTHTLLESYPLLTKLFLPLASAIKRGNLYSYDLAMSSGEEYFSKRRIYLTLERAREICIRNLFHRVFLSGGYEKDNDNATGKPVRETAFSVDQFVAAMRLSMRGPDERVGGNTGGSGHGGEVVERDEVECLMANAFYKVSSPILRLCLVSALFPIGCLVGLGRWQRWKPTWQITSVSPRPAMLPKLARHIPPSQQNALFHLLWH
jgi:hypothetical protein